MPTLSVQLYSIRDALKADLPGAIARLAQIGFTSVEPYDIVGDPAGLRAALDANGLRAPSAHVRLGDDLDRMFDAAATVGVHTVVQAVSPSELWESEDGVATVAEQLNRAAEQAAGLGLRMGYHNHQWELADAALERFAERLHPAVVLELDTYWAAVGGRDVPALLRRLGDRVRLLHLKDGPISRDNTEQLPLGEGAMPVEEIVAAAGAAELGVLEFDDYAGDVFEGLAAGFAYATGLGIR